MSDFSSWSLPFVIAHRGAPLLATENTLDALMKAKEQGASAVECDIQLTRDQMPVILHDATLDRTTCLSGLLSKISLKKLKALEAGVPTLQEWLQTAAQLKLKLNLEIKARTKKQSELLAGIVLDHIKKYWPDNLSTPFISSSNLYCLSQIAKRNKKLLTGLIIEKKISDKTCDELLKKNIISLHQPYRLLNAKYIAKLHAKGLRVLAYTVNDLKCLKKLIAMKIDGVFTDDHTLYGAKTLQHHQHFFCAR